MRLKASGDFRLIDMDCACKLGDAVGAKANNSSAFAPPEMLFREGNAILLKDSSNRKNHEYRKLPAAPTYDIWSFGVMLFYALRWRTLFEVGFTRVTASA